MKQAARGSGAARDLVTGVKLAIEGPPGPVGPLPKMKTSRVSPTLLSRGPQSGKLGPLEPTIGPLMRLKLDPCRPGMSPLKQ